MRPGTLLLVLLLGGLYLMTYSRTVLHDGEPPAFFMENRDGVMVMLGDGFPIPGIHQFNDGATPADVIELTLSGGPSLVPGTPETEIPLISGESLSLHIEPGKVAEIKREMLPASHRITLGIPLHPDRMSLDDWEALPGLGPKLAERIEKDRQQNGDFGSLEALDRVRGIGPSRVAAWKEFF